MIYLVTKKQELFPNEKYSIISVEKSLELLENFTKHIVQFDTETMGLDPHIDACLTFQFGNIEETIQIVVDTTTVNPYYYKHIFDTYFIIGQNLLFDSKVCFKYDLIIRRCWDCMVVEQLLYLGFPHFMVGASPEIIMQYSEVVSSCKNWEDMNAKQRKTYLEDTVPMVYDFIQNYSGVGLKALCKRYLNEDMSKEIRGQIIYRGLDTEVIEYAAGDVKPLYRIMQKQLEILKNLNMVQAAKVECEFVPVCAYYEWCGVHMNVNLWQEKMNKDREKRDNALNALNDFVVAFGNTKFIENDTQLDLFNPEPPKPKSNINWNSPKQVIPFLTLLGFNCKGIDKKTKEEKDSLDASVLAPQRHKNPEFYDIYLAYSEAQKVCSTYGQNYLNAINPKTNRVHTTFRQLGTDTGRLACGSQTQNVSLAKLKGLPQTKQEKNPEKKCAYPQLQNLPADEITRASFCAEEGNAWISVDYCGQESVLMADFSQDQAMLDVFLKGEDMHSTVAYMIYPDEISRDTSIKDIKKLYKHLRQEAKGPEFCFAYGGNDSTLVAQYGMSSDKAKSIYENYMKGFPGIAQFQNYQKKFVVQNGYILISPVTGHKAFWWDWEHWKKVQSSYTPEFWEEYKLYHKGTGDNIAKKVSTHFKAKTKWEKNACNSPLQGSGAIIFKIFNRMLFNWVLEKGYFNKVKFCVPVHDEINVECPNEIAEEVRAKIQEIMREAAKPFLKVLELDSDASRFSICKKNYIQDGEFLAIAGDIVCINEHSFHNVTKNLRLPIVIKDKSYFDSEGPLPTYWIH